MLGVNGQKRSEWINLRTHAWKKVEKGSNIESLLLSEKIGEILIFIRNYATEYESGRVWARKLGKVGIFKWREWDAMTKLRIKNELLKKKIVK